MPPREWPSVTEHTGLVHAVAARTWNPSYRAVGMELDDAISVGWIGLLNAHERYDPSRGVKFSTYAQRHISGAIKDAARSASWAPRGVSDMAVYRSLDAPSNPHRPDSASRATLLADPVGDFATAIAELAEDRAAIDLLRYHSNLRIRHVFGSLLAGEKMLTIGEVEGITESRVSQLYTGAIADLLGSTHHHYHRDPLYMPGRRAVFWRHRGLTVAAIALHLGYHPRAVRRLLELDA